MAAKFVFLFFTVCILQVSLGARFVRDAPATTGGLDELSKQASEWLTTLGTQFSEVTQAKDITEVTAIVKNSTENLATQLTGLVTGLQSKLSDATQDQSTVIGQVVAKLNQTIADLQAANPETASKAKEVNDQFQKGLETIATEFGKVQQTFTENTKGVQGDLEKLTKQAYDGIVKSAQSVQEQIKAATTKQ